MVRPSRSARPNFIDGWHIICNRRPFFLDQIDRAPNNLNRYWILAWSGTGFPAKTQGENEEILDLWIAKDKRGLMRLVAQHIEASGHVALNYRSRLEATERAPLSK